MGKQKFQRGDEVIPKIGRFKGKKGVVTDYDLVTRFYDVRFGYNYPQYRHFCAADLDPAPSV